MSKMRLEPYPYCDDPTDRVAYRNSLEQKMREMVIAVEITKILRERVELCYKREGVNHYEHCREYTQAYWKVIRKGPPVPLDPPGEAERRAAGKGRYRRLKPAFQLGPGSPGFTGPPGSFTPHHKDH
ncbi:hypothetical protein M885DRAFT_619551 [Pelagophyceae sp. CCMP2097]|nr:hypothetical protein M885DRAFT_619551 [Pelagophyceae sp. CCMP2097]